MGSLPGIADGRTVRLVQFEVPGNYIGAIRCRDGGRARLKWGLRGLGATPDLVIVELGANDLLRGLPVVQASTNIDAIVAELRGRGISVLVAGMRAAPRLEPDYGRAFDGMSPTLARARRVSLYPFFLDGVAGRRELIQADGLHPNARGVDVIVARILPAVQRALIATTAGRAG